VDDQNKSSKIEENKSEPSIRQSLRTIDLILGCIRWFNDSGDLWIGVVEKYFKLKVRRRHRFFDWVEEQESFELFLFSDRHFVSILCVGVIKRKIVEAQNNAIWVVDIGACWRLLILLPIVRQFIDCVFGFKRFIKSWSPETPRSQSLRALGSQPLVLWRFNVKEKNH